MKTIFTKTYYCIFCDIKLSAKFCSYQESWQTAWHRSVLRKCSSVRGNQGWKHLRHLRQVFWKNWKYCRKFVYLHWKHNGNVERIYLLNVCNLILFCSHRRWSLRTPCLHYSIMPWDSVWLIVNLCGICLLLMLRSAIVIFIYSQ